MPNYKQISIGGTEGLFTITTPKKKFNANAIKFGGDYRYVARSENNNGIRGYITEDIQFLNPANTITFGQDTATMFFQNAPYFTGDKIKVFTLKNRELTREIAIFLIAAMKKAFITFSWGRSSFNVKVLEKVKVSIPMTDNGEIDFAFMENSIRRLELKHISSLEKYLQITGLDNVDITLNEQNFVSDFYAGVIRHKEFPLDDLFYKKEMPHDDSRTFRVKERDVNHNVAGVVAKYDDNGVMYWVKEGEFKFTTDQDGITVIANGAVASGRVFYQEHKYTILNDAYTIKLKGSEVIGRDLGLYLALAIEKRLFSTYSWENKPTWDKVKNDTIELPVDINGNPDYQFMSRFMRIQQKLAIKNVIDWKEKEKVACRVATAN